MVSHNVTCHPAEVTFPPLLQPIKAGTRLSDAERCNAELTVSAWLHTEVVYPPEHGHPSQY